MSNQNLKNNKTILLATLQSYSVPELQTLQSNISQMIQMKELQARVAARRAATPQSNTPTPPVVGGKRVVKKKRIIKK